MTVDVCRRFIMIFLQDLFTENDKYTARPYVTVGKLKIKVFLELFKLMNLTLRNI